LAWLEVRIIVQNKHITEQSRIESLEVWIMTDSLGIKMKLSAVTRHLRYSAAKHFKEIVCQVIHWAQSLHGDWRKHVCHGELRIFLA